MLTLTKETSVNGVETVPLFWSMVSHVPPESAEALALQLIDPRPVFRIPKFCGSGVPPCSTAVNVKPVCDSRIICCVALIDRVPGTVMVGVAVPFAGETWSQLPPVDVEGLAVKETDPPPWFETLNCVLVLGDPWVTEKATLGLLTASFPIAAWLTFRFTLAVCVAPGIVIVMLPV